MSVTTILLWIILAVVLWRYGSVVARFGGLVIVGLSAWTILADGITATTATSRAWSRPWPPRPAAQPTGPRASGPTPTPPPRTATTYAAR